MGFLSCFFSTDMYHISVHVFYPPVFMLSLNPSSTAFRNNLKSYFDLVCRQHEAVVVRRRNKENIVLIVKNRAVIRTDSNRIMTRRPRKIPSKVNPLSQKTGVIIQAKRGGYTLVYTSRYGRRPWA